MIEIRAYKESYLTNFFLGEQRSKLLINYQLLYQINFGKCIFILHKDHDFFHVYFLATDAGHIENALHQLIKQHTGETFVTDIVGLKDSVMQIIGSFKHVGFDHYTTLYRMNRMKEIDQPQIVDSRVKYATNDQAGQIYDLLESNFDKYCEQIPLRDEIDQWITDHRVLVITDKYDVIGFVIFEINGITSYLRYWFTHPSYRDQKIGSALLRYFFHECRHTKRQLFWVIDTNENAIARYKSYGFEAEQMFDQVLIKNK